MNSAAAQDVPPPGEPSTQATSQTATQPATQPTSQPTTSQAVREQKREAEIKEELADETAREAEPKLEEIREEQEEVEREAERAVFPQAAQAKLERLEVEEAYEERQKELSALRLRYPCRAMRSGRFGIVTIARSRPAHLPSLPQGGGGIPLSAHLGRATFASPLQEPWRHKVLRQDSMSGNQPRP